MPPLPEPHPDRWQWRPLVEIALGPTPRRLDAHKHLVKAMAEREVSNDR
jgi:hypothetical protein